jgi:hypothetical protein
VLENHVKSIAKRISKEQLIKEEMNEDAAELPHVHMIGD